MREVQADAVERRADLELAIAALVQEFTDETGLWVERINVEQMQITEFGTARPVRHYGMVRITAVLP